MTQVANDNPLLERLLSWCKEELAELEKQNELMKAGTFTIHSHEPGKGMVDKTEESIGRNLLKIEELQRLLARHSGT